MLRGAEVLVDQHGHGVLHGDLGLGTFQARLAAATGSGIPAGGKHFDRRTGLARTADGSCAREAAGRIARIVADGDAPRIYGCDEAAAG